MKQTKHSQIKGKITSIKNYLIGLGATFVKESDKSDSVYLKLKNDKVRVSDHVSPIAATLGINIVVPMNSKSATIVTVNGAAMVYNTTSELKSFLKYWVNIVECLQYSKESALNSDILKKQYDLNCLSDSVKAEKNKLAAIEGSIQSKTKKLETLEKMSEFTLVGLSEKQVDGITKQIEMYRAQNAKKNKKQQI